MIFPEDEAHHAVRVLRIKTGEEVAVVDGEGNWYRTTVEVLGRRKLVGRVQEHRRSVGEPPYDLVIGIGMLKNANRFETFLEKAVELGVRRVIPLNTKRSERSRIKKKRVETIVMSAMKQTGRSRRMEISEAVKLRKWIKDLPDAQGEFRAICHKREADDQNLSEALLMAETKKTIRILIGPEGGFMDEELGLAVGAEFTIVSLGPRRLRTETAAMVAASTVMLHAYNEAKLETRIIAR
ncbi:MAG: 16S rRNA (uracil(1498)-N(3))-methyltransferase [Deltaproteobacteria bacterium]|nr:16S rRNA (uracil(1498)-N(3))-methyltransferase [Deltaproteobacteria bacterium]